MKLHRAIKDQEMKYPALANVLLDIGMFLVIVAGFCLLYSAVYAQSYDTVATASVMALVAGAVAVGVAGRIAKVRRVSDTDAPPALRRVK